MARFYISTKTLFPRMFYRQIGTTVVTTLNRSSIYHVPDFIQLPHLHYQVNDDLPYYIFREFQAHCLLHIAQAISVTSS